MKSKPDLVFAFDLGTGSVGECVREGKDVKHLASLLLPAEFASIKDAAQRRRAWRTRLSHRAREEWWKKCAKEAGIPVPDTNPQNKHNPFQSEFSDKDDNTVYTSCLLRIKLLRGDKLEGWQVFKAVWSAIQHRGYDEKLPWKTKEERNTEKDETVPSDTTLTEEKQKKNISKDDEAKAKDAADAYIEYLKKKNIPKQYHYPCYYEAYKMGLWKPDKPLQLQTRIIVPVTDSARNRHTTEKDPGMAAPRHLIEKELKDMLANIPALKGKEDYVLYGPEARGQYATYRGKKSKPNPCFNPELEKYRGKEWVYDKKNKNEPYRFNAMGLVGQKVPRFDNRIISKCCCISRLNVCKAKDPLNKEVTFLWKLKNIRYIAPPNPDKMLSAQEIVALNNKYKEKYKLTPTQWRNFVKSINEKNDINPAHIEVEKPKTSGRSRYCRPALHIIKEIILSGKSPMEYYKEKTSAITNNDERKGLVKADFEFLQHAGDSWENFYPPDQRHQDAEIAKIDDYKLRADTINKKIEEIINESNNPIVRHRLRLFYKRIQELKRTYGAPDKVVLEFVRDDFMGEEQKKEYIKRMNANKKNRDEAFDALGENKGKGNLAKMILFREQAGKDMYPRNISNDPYALELGTLEASRLDEYEIDHVIPRSKPHEGPDAAWNRVLTTHDNNQAKGNQTPYEWLHGKPIWEGYVKHIDELKGLSSKKKETLITSDHGELLKNTQLAQTAYISKLSQSIVALYFGLTPGKGIETVSGGRTAKMRKQYRLDRLLHPQITDDRIIKSLAVYDECLYSKYDIDAEAFVKEHKAEYVLINDELAKNGVELNQPETITSEKIAGVFNKLIRIPNLTDLLKDGKGLLDEGKEKATAKIKRQNKKKIAEIYPNTVKQAAKESLDHKNRANPRHHALDALALSFMPDWEYRPEDKKDILPKWAEDPNFFDTALSFVEHKQIAYSKPKLAEAIYGKGVIKQKDGFHTVLITRQGKGTRIGEYKKLADAKKKWVKKIYSDEIRNDFTKKLEENPSQGAWQDFVENYKTANGTKPFRIALIEYQSKQGTPTSQTLPIPSDYRELRSQSGQFYKTKTGEELSYPARLICKNDKGKWIVYPVFAWDRLNERILEAKKNHKDVKVFRSQQKILIKKDCKKGNIKAGQYVFATIHHKDTGDTVDIERHGIEVNASLNELMNVGEMCPMHCHRLFYD